MLKGDGNENDLISQKNKQTNKQTNLNVQYTFFSN